MIADLHAEVNDAGRVREGREVRGSDTEHQHAQHPLRVRHRAQPVERREQHDRGIDEPRLQRDEALHHVIAAVLDEGEGGDPRERRVGDEQEEAEMDRRQLEAEVPRQRDPEQQHEHDGVQQSVLDAHARHETHAKAKDVADDEGGDQQEE